jgi:hypothetical protein
MLQEYRACQAVGCGGAHQCGAFQHDDEPRIGIGQRLRQPILALTRLGASVEVGTGEGICRAHILPES